MPKIKRPKIPEKSAASLQYIRVGIDYFKIIHKPDRYNILQKEIKRWNKQEITQDWGKQILYDIPKYDDFILKPDNINFEQIYKNCYNLYNPISYIPQKGEWKWSEILLRHVFGDQFEAGLKYLQLLYLYPEQILPVLVLVSTTRQTGKSTFIDWVNAIFGKNVANIEPDSIGSTFNGEYAAANIITIDETMIERKSAVEKIKSLATKKYISVNMKFINNFKLPFFGKFILASNNEDDFMRISDEEIRFWVRKLSIPEEFNHNIDIDLVSEIPAFLHYLSSLPDPFVDGKKSRMVFTPEEISNEYLLKVKKQSHSGLFKELTEILTEYFENNETKEFVYARPSDIKIKYFFNNARIERNYIRRVLKTEFKLEAKETMRVADYESLMEIGFLGRPFLFEKSMFFDENDLKKAEILPF